MNRRTKAILPLGVIATLVVAGCTSAGSSAPASAGASAAASEAVPSVDPAAACEGVETLTFTHTMNDQESPVIAEIAEAFEGTTVEVTQIPFDGAQAAYDQQAAGGRGARRLPGRDRLDRRLRGQGLPDRPDRAHLAGRVGRLPSRARWRTGSGRAAPTPSRK